MGRRIKLVIGMALAIVGISLAGKSVAARPDQDTPSKKPASTEAGGVEQPLVLPQTKVAPRAKPKVKSKTKANPAPTPSPATPVEGDAKVERGALPVDFPAGEAPGSKTVRAEADASSQAPKVPVGEPIPVPELPPAQAMPEPAVIEEPGGAKRAEPEGAALKDVEVERAQVAGLPIAAQPTGVDAVGGPLPGAKERPGQAAPASSGTPAGREDEISFVQPADRLPLGKQSVGLTVDVVAPQVLNLNQSANLKIVVKNTGQNDAIGVVVRDVLPPTLTYVGSQPEAQRIDAMLSWNLGLIPAGSERVVTVSVKPNKTGSFDHAATVTMITGGKSRTVVREPKLKVEQTATSGQILRGQPVQFKIAVSNPGDGPARNVLVQAKLTSGLRHESGEPNDQNLYEQTIDLIAPGQRVTLDTLVADTIQGGDQSCQVAVKSQDVAPGAPEALSTATVNVVEPKLTLLVNGPKEGYTDTLSTYEISLENPGTAPARGLRVQATVPISGRLAALPSGAQFNSQTRKLSWARPQLDPGEKAVFSFQVRMGGIGLYEVAGEARAEGGLLAKGGPISTNVQGLVDVTFDVTEKRRVVDVDGQTTYVIKVTNSGSKEASGLTISAVLSEQVDPMETSGTEEPAKFNPPDRRLVFPKIERLGAGKTMELGIKVRATKPGLATCRVSLVHDDLAEKLDDVAAFKVMPVRR